MVKDGLLEGDGRAGRGWDGRADGEMGRTKVRRGKMDSGEMHGGSPYFQSSDP